MAKLVSTLRQVLQNIPLYEPELQKSNALQGRLSFARAWYAWRDAAEKWHFAPSKFCGYLGMTAFEYVNEDNLDGRRTERQLSNWFTEVPQSDPLYQTLASELGSLLEIYGKIPSAKMRINVEKSFWESHLSVSKDGLDSSLTDLLIIVARQLPMAARIRLKAVL